VFNTQYKCHSLTKGFKGVVYLQAFENEYNNRKQSFTTGSGVKFVAGITKVGSSRLFT